MISERELTLMCALCALLGLLIGAGIVGLFAALKTVLRSTYQKTLTDYQVTSDQLKLVTAERDELKQQIEERKSDDNSSPIRFGDRPTLMKVKNAAEHAAQHAAKGGASISVKRIQP